MAVLECGCYSPEQHLSAVTHSFHVEAAAAKWVQVEGVMRDLGAGLGEALRMVYAVCFPGAWPMQDAQRDSSWLDWMDLASPYASETVEAAFYACELAVVEVEA